MSEAQFTIATIYPDASDTGSPKTLKTPHPYVTRATYTNESVGVAPLADTAPAGTEVALDFGLIADEATGFVVKNKTGQDLAVAFNGAVLTSAANTFETAAGTLKTAATTFETAASALETAASTFETAAGTLKTAATTFETAVSTQIATLTGFTGGDAAADIVTAIGAAAGVLATAATTLDTAKTTFDTAKTALDTAKTTFDTAKTALDTAKTTFDTAKTTFDTAKTAAVFTMPDGAVLAYATPALATTEIGSISLFATTTQSGDGQVEFKIFGNAT